MKYTEKSKISTVDDVKAFFNYLIYECRIAFHPDDNFEDYVSVQDGQSIFPQKTSDIYNRLMNDSFDVCEKNGIDIYELGLTAITSGKDTYSKNIKHKTTQQ